MPVLLAASRWTLRALAASPAAWFGGLGLLALWPTILVLSRYGITVEEGTGVAAVYAVAFISLLTGSLLGLSLLERSRGLWELHPSRHQRSAELGILGTSLILGALIGLAGPLVLPAVRSDLTTLLPKALLAGLHLLALARLIQRVPGLGALRLALLPLVAWVLPAAMSQSEAFGAPIWNALAASQHLQPASDGVFNPAGWIAPLLPIIGLSLLAEIRRRP